MSFIVQGLTKQYKHRNGTVINALLDVSITIESGQFITITGASGSGKSTLLFTLGGLLRPTSGSIEFQGQNLHKSNDRALSEFRRRHIGYVMQNFFLVPYLTTEDNVMVAASLLHKDRRKQREISSSLLSQVGLEDRAQHYPRELSSGQQQRVAIARALANSPSVILADEPTGNLDPQLATEILTLLREVNRDRGITVIMVTHSPDAAKNGTKRIHLQDGRLV
jgi:putative ABC transport system ATP-binding protein